MIPEPLPLENYRPDPEFLVGRRILVTGAGDGIGRALALELAHRGADLILLGRTPAKLESLYDQIESETKTEPTLCPLDLQELSDEGAGYVAEHILEHSGRLDGLIHNAGILGQRTPLANYETKIWNQVMQVNLTAAFILTKALLPALRESDDARILFTSSGVGHAGRAYWGAYSVSKIATEGLCEILSQEEFPTHGVAVNCINPGPTRTSMRAKAYPAEDPARVTAPDDKVPGYLWLLDEASRGLSGKSFDI